MKLYMSVWLVSFPTSRPHSPPCICHSTFNMQQTMAKAFYCLARRQSNFYTLLSPSSWDMVLRYVATG